MTLVVLSMVARVVILGAVLIAVMTTVGMLLLRVMVVMVIRVRRATGLCLALVLAAGRRRLRRAVIVVTHWFGYEVGWFFSSFFVPKAFFKNFVFPSPPSLPPFGGPTFLLQLIFLFLVMSTKAARE
jgi:hypothetical protein